ncbi:hypothetical protein FACS1894191_2150 [Clostridia bacterium]|nr:hypothetical protein FACS1894191_2150 [Clostridia bacterium]
MFGFKKPVFMRLSPVVIKYMAPSGRLGQLGLARRWDLQGLQGQWDLRGQWLLPFMHKSKKPYKQWVSKPIKIIQQLHNHTENVTKRWTSL